jgi:hypothetical protein
MVPVVIVVALLQIEYGIERERREERGGGSRRTSCLVELHRGRITYYSARSVFEATDRWLRNWQVIVQCFLRKRDMEKSREPKLFFSTSF